MPPPLARFLRCTALALSVALPLAVAPAAVADPADDAALVARYAPVVRLVQPDSCGGGQPYIPTDVSLLFDEPTVALRGPWDHDDLIKVAPSASDLGGGLYEYHLDFPGHALSPGCDYITWSRRINLGQRPVVYAHVVTEPGYPGRLALQYWMFYVFNDWNNLHEGDWEMIQLNFDAADSAAALQTQPSEVGYSQHEGAEKAAWGDPKLERAGTHPVVYPADGSHANFYGQALYLGASGSQGVGCDDTRDASLVLHPGVQTIPSDPGQATAQFPWIAFEGRWGERQPAFFNGPTGPNLKTQWTHPFTWAKEWRDRSYAVPAGGALGTGTTDFFCGAMSRGSVLLWRAVDNPAPTIAVVLGTLILVAWLLSRARWRPAAPRRMARRRAWGQVLSASARMYVRSPRLLLGIGVLLLPLSFVITLLQALVLSAGSLFGVEVAGEAGGTFVMIAVVIGTALTLLGFGLVQAATVRAMVEIDQGREVRPLAAYRMALDCVGPLLAALVVAVAVATLLAATFFLIPVAVWLAVRWSLIAPVVELERLRPRAALRRSSHLVKGHWFKVGSLTIVSAAIALLAGPLLGTALILLTDLPLALLNVVAGIVYTLTMPFVALTTAYVYFDCRVRDALAEPEPLELPAELELG